ncbi:MAG: membrane dipeptidase [Acidobacteria bacterium]|nr:MAG: membrane dipeptidase [Acidobacteriota bacterium]PYU61793.1 MAG: membrane dipeptidase [Acidobacteriota bacterium]
MVRAILCAGASLAASVFLAGAMKEDSLSERARKLHFSSIVVDTHDDTTQRLLDGKFDLGTRSSTGSIDIPRMREGNVGAIFFSIWMPSKVTGPDAVNRAIVQIDAVREQVRKHPNDLVLATTAAEIRDAHKQGKIAALLGVEGGHIINSDLGVLRAYAALGVRYMTLTHSGNDEWADSSTDQAVHNGLTDFGREVVREMNRLGMMVDISHVSDKTFYDALETSKAPLIASHSSCRAICDAPRNMTDQMMKDLAAKGGVVQINYHVGFLSQEFRDAEKANPELNKTISAEVMKRCADNEGCQLIEGDRITREYVEQGKLPRVEFSKIIEHIDHAVKVAGIDHVGLGSDFDGANMPYGMEDAAKLPRITEALLQKGYAEGDVKKILGENTLRVMTDVQLISRELNGGKQKQESRLQ